MFNKKEKFWERKRDIFETTFLSKGEIKKDYVATYYDNYDYVKAFSIDMFCMREIRILKSLFKNKIIEYSEMSLRAVLPGDALWIYVEFNGKKEGHDIDHCYAVDVFYKGRIYTFFGEKEDILDIFPLTDGEKLLLELGEYGFERTT